jgi:N-acetylneuraminic acid mutarotase
MKLRSPGILVLILLLNGCTKNSSVATTIPHNKWQTLSSMPTIRSDLGFVACNNLLYAIGGTGINDSSQDRVDAYDPVTDKWSTKTPMPTGRKFLVVATVTNKIYAIGGFGGQEDVFKYIKATEEYDPALDTWTERSPIPLTADPSDTVFGNFFMTGAAINGKIYVAAGHKGGDIPTYIYDPAIDTWTTGKSISKFDFQPYYSTAANNSLYVINGNDFLQYTPSNDEWKELPLPLTSVSDSVYGTCLAAYNGDIYGIGGYFSTGNVLTLLTTTLSNVETFNPANLSWSEDSSLIYGRFASAAAVYNDKLYVAGGAEKQRLLSIYANVPTADLQVLSLK